jgi:hypothetical protein
MRLFITASILLLLAGCAQLDPAKPQPTEADKAAKAAECATMVGEDRLVCYPF